MLNEKSRISSGARPTRASRCSGPALVSFRSSQNERADRFAEIFAMPRCQHPERRHLIVKGMMRSLANVHCEPLVPPPNGVVLFKDVS